MTELLFSYHAFTILNHCAPLSKNYGAGAFFFAQFFVYAVSFLPRILCVQEGELFGVDLL